MNTYIYTPGENTVTYPPHSHEHWEIIYYLSGSGYLYTPERNYEFEKDTILIVPPGIIHGSVSRQGFQGIPVGGEFGHIFMFDTVQTISHATQEAQMLMKMIYENRSIQDGYLASLCISYCYCLLKNLNHQNKLIAAVNQIAAVIAENALSSDFDLMAALDASGYARDYIRSCFKTYTGKTPTEFLIYERMQHAVSLLDIYGDSITVGELAEKCGYTDAIYFSRLFKQHTGFSPVQFRKQK